VEDEKEHSSCKNTIKITEQQDFTFFKDGHSASANLSQNKVNNGQSGYSQERS
jgi:hypothetical protein